LLFNSIQYSLQDKCLLKIKTLKEPLIIQCRYYFTNLFALCSSCLSSSSSSFLSTLKFCSSLLVFSSCWVVHNLKYKEALTEDRTCVYVPSKANLQDNLSHLSSGFCLSSTSFEVGATANIIICHVSSLN